MSTPDESMKKLMSASISMSINVKTFLSDIYVKIVEHLLGEGPSVDYIRKMLLTRLVIPSITKEDTIASQTLLEGVRYDMELGAELLNRDAKTVESLNKKFDSISDIIRLDIQDAERIKKIIDLLI